MVLVDFIINPQLGPQSRVGRSFEDHKNGRQMILEAKRKVTTDAAASEALGRADSALELQ